MKRMRILLYNHVGDYPSGAMEDGIHPESLAEQLEYLSTHGYSIVCLDEMIACMEGTKTLPENSMAITIDGASQMPSLMFCPSWKNMVLRRHFSLPPALLAATD